MGSFNHLAYNVCDDYDLQVFPAIQDCTDYPQRLSQICGVIILPIGATKPADWTTIEGWAGVIDNTDTSGAKARYLVGVGSFLPVGENVVRLAGGRSEHYGDRRWQCAFDVLNMDTGHLDFGKRLQGGYKAFNVWIETVGGRLIGGEEGMSPFLVNSKTPFEKSSNSTERLETIFDFFFPAVPG
jgi:hypothetical protein